MSHKMFRNISKIYVLGIDIILLQCEVTASHIVVNQLVDDFLTPTEMDKIGRLLAGCGKGGYEGKSNKV